MAADGATSPPTVDRTLRRADNRLGRLEDVFNIASGLCIVFLMGLGVAQVVGRLLLNTPVFGYIDLVELAMVAFAFLGVAYCQRVGGHVRMELFLSRLGPRARWIYEAGGVTVALVIISILIWYSFAHVARAWSAGDTTIDADFATWPSKLVIPVALSLLWLRLALQLAAFTRLVRFPGAVPIAAPITGSVIEQAEHEVHEALVVPGVIPDAAPDPRRNQ